MLQQTRVSTVLPYYASFLERWPTVTHLANANPDVVRAAWAGLGYYRRAELMLRAARHIARVHSGRFPTAYEALRALPGFGAYTAGAVASFAFDAPVAAVDGNVLRVLSRHLAISGDVRRGAAHRAVWQAAEAWVPRRNAGAHNQALIELGATLCTARRPDCPSCPLRDDCIAHREDTVHRYPEAAPRPEKKRIDRTALVLRHKDSVLLEVQPTDGLFAGLLCPPQVDGHGGAEATARIIHALAGPSPSGLERMGQIEHVLTHRILTVEVWRGSTERRGPRRAHRRWVPLGKLADAALPSFSTKILRVALAEDTALTENLPGRSARRKAHQNADPRSGGGVANGP